jgi:hypothetical protein
MMRERRKLMELRGEESLLVVACSWEGNQRRECQWVVLARGELAWRLSLRSGKTLQDYMFKEETRSAQQTRSREMQDDARYTFHPTIRL